METWNRKISCRARLDNEDAALQDVLQLRRCVVASLRHGTPELPISVRLRHFQVVAIELVVPHLRHQL